MIVSTANNPPTWSTMASMSNSLLDTTGKRITWARKRMDITQKALSARLGISHVYLNQVESNARQPSRKLITNIASELGVSIGFLELETEDPAPAKTDALEPVYWHEETDAIATIVDKMPDVQRRFVLDFVRLLVEYQAGNSNESPASTWAGLVRREPDKRVDAGRL